MRFIRALSLTRQFLVLSFLIMGLGMVVIGLFLNQQITQGVMSQTAAVTALYVDSFISPHLQNNGAMLETQLSDLDNLLENTPLGQEIVAFKIWSPDGEILYSPNKNLIGMTYPVEADLKAALDGAVVSELSFLNKPEHEYERQYWDSLIESYAPIRMDNNGEIFAVSEFYQLPDSLAAATQGARMRSWGVVIIATITMYALQAGLVQRASRTIEVQRRELAEKVDQLSELLERNEQLSQRILRAANRTTSLNERHLRRISADLHDGPMQDISLALLRIDTLSSACEKCNMLTGNGKSTAKDFATMKHSLTSSLKELRSIAAGLRIPAVEDLSIVRLVRRVVRDHERKTGHRVEIEFDNAPDSAPTPVKISIYRVLQEALSNGSRHAGGADLFVRVAGGERNIHIQVEDGGQGFELEETYQENGKHLGLAGMRERVELLGGVFRVSSASQAGTQIHASIPVSIIHGNKI